MKKQTHAAAQQSDDQVTSAIDFQIAAARTEHNFHTALEKCMEFLDFAIDLGEGKIHPFGCKEEVKHKLLEIKQYVKDLPAELKSQLLLGLLKEIDRGYLDLIFPYCVIHGGYKTIADHSSIPQDNMKSYVTDFDFGSLGKVQEYSDVIMN